MEDFQRKASDLVRLYADQFAVIVMDIADFKMINEFCSRSTGDELLSYIDDCFHEYEGDKTTISHLRADCFAMCLSYRSESELITTVNHLSDKIRSFPISSKVMPAFGICPIFDKKRSIACYQDYAFLALKSVKGKYFSNYAFFNMEMYEELILQKKIEDSFDNAILGDQFKLYVQPKVEMNSGKVIGGEALVRWSHPELGIISPNDFIPILEKNASIIEMDKVIWKKVFHLLSHLIKDYHIEIPISINISRLHAYDKTLVETLLAYSSDYEVPPYLVPLELTESAYSESDDLMYEKLLSLKKQGFLFSMDDFGSGYSTMNMLVEQPVDEVKIDRLFLNNMNNAKSQTLVQHTISMLRDLNMPIVVEGVETVTQQDMLTKWGCNYAQGFLYYQPMPAGEFKELLISQ